MALSAQPGWAPGSVVDTLNLPQSLSLKLTTIDMIGGIKCPLCHITFGNKKDYDSHYVNHEKGSPNIVYMCVVCHKEITGYPSFRNHCYSNHVVKDRFKCQDCSKQFSKSSVLQQHIDTVHKFICVHCKKQFSSKKEMQMHQITHKSDSPPYDCQTCGQQIETADSCEQHIDDHCTLTYSCPICNEIIPDKAETVDHLMKHFGKDTKEEEIPESDVEITLDSSIDLIGGILCCYCDTTHKNRLELDTHFAENHFETEIIYTCNICRKTYSKYHLFGNHCYYHYSKDRFECDECDKSFSRLSLLVLHTEAYHSGAPAAKPFVCAFCCHAYASERRLRSHMQDSHADTCLSCTEHGCGQTFDTPKDLIYHQAVHKSANRCQHCLLQFTSLAACERHIPMHCKKQYSCPVCTRSYAEKYLVMKHISQHFSSVLHLCKVCGKIFNAKHRLSQHLKVHSEARNYKCTFCDKAFGKATHLKQHQNIHTGLKPYRCSMCPKTFASYPNYHKHMRRMHNVLKVPVNTSFEFEINENDTEIKENASSNNNVMEEFVDSTSSELESYSLMEESDDSVVESEGIDPVAMERESQYCETPDFSLQAPEYTELLPPDNHDAFVAAVLPPSDFAPPAEAPPQEYGPDFGNYVSGFVDLDEQLQYIDPLLTIKTQTDMYVHQLGDFAYQSYDYGEHGDPAFVGWEPLIAKVNTDIF